MCCQRLFAGLLCLVVSLAMGRQVASQTNSPSPEEKPRKVKKEPSRAYRDWPKQDVALIITTEELRAYEKLATDEEREQFIMKFWDLRDPDPDTIENEFKDEHYERISYANERFTSGKPGHLTDRGRIYIKFGKPDEIESHPSGGPYQRPSYEGGESVTAFPFERWFYRYIPGVGSGVEIEFVDPTGSGEYRMARSVDDKVAFLPPGAAIRDNSSSYRREQDSPFAISDLISRLERAPEFRPNSFPGGTRTHSALVDENPLDFDIGVAFFRQADNRVVTAFTIQAPNSELVFKDIGGLQTAHLNVWGKIVSITEKRVGAFEDSLRTTATAEELNQARTRKSAYAKAVVLAPGHYRLDVLLRDTESGAEGFKAFGFEVPKFDDSLATSSLVLTAKLENLSGSAAVDPFVIGENKVVPNLTRTYRRGDPVGIYLQIYNAGIDQTTLRPAVTVEYVLMKDGKEWRREREDWNGVNEVGQRLTLARLLKSDHLAPGEYEIVIRVSDMVANKTIEPAAKFKIVQ